MRDEELERRTSDNAKDTEECHWGRTTPPEDGESAQSVTPYNRLDDEASDEEEGAARRFTVGFAFCFVELICEEEGERWWTRDKEERRR